MHKYSIILLSKQTNAYEFIFKTWSSITYKYCNFLGLLIKVFTIFIFNNLNSYIHNIVKDLLYVCVVYKYDQLIYIDLWSTCSSLPFLYNCRTNYHVTLWYFQCCTDSTLFLFFLWVTMRTGALIDLILVNLWMRKSKIIPLRTHTKKQYQLKERLLKGKLTLQSLINDTLSVTSTLTAAFVPSSL